MQGSITDSLFTCPAVPLPATPGSPAGMFTIIVKTNAGSDLQPRFQETELTARTAAELAVQSAQLLVAAANPASPQFVASERARASLTACLQLAPPRPAAALGCPRIFDSLVCFNWTAAGEVAQSACPAGHPTLGNPAGFVNKQCQEDGQWQREPFTNLTWSNYSNCIFGLEDSGSFDTVGKITYHPIIEDSFVLDVGLQTLPWQAMTTLSVAGYSVSIFFLLISLLIFFQFRSLSCGRVTMHKNLFLALTLSSVFWLCYLGP